MQKKRKMTLETYEAHYEVTCYGNKEFPNSTNYVGDHFIRIKATPKKVTSYALDVGRKLAQRELNEGRGLWEKVEAILQNLTPLKTQTHLEEKVDATLVNQ